MLHRIRNIQFFCYLLYFVCQANFPSEISTIIRTKARSLYLSDDHFIEAIRSHGREDLREMTELPWVVKLHRSCNHVCHQAIIDHYSEDKYEILDSHHAIVVSTKARLTSMQTGAVNRHQSLRPLLHGEPLLSDFIQLHPSLKISSDLYDILGPTRSQTGFPEGPVEVRMVWNSMTTQRHTAFAAHLRSILSTYLTNKEVTFESSYPEGGERQRLFVSLIIAEVAVGWEVLQLLAGEADILWMERAYKVFTHNKWAKGVCDTGNPYEAPLNSVNITGEGEVVGIADTGLDTYNCYFYDPSVKLHFQTNGTSTVLNPMHRKIVQYIAAGGIGDRYDSTEGHGTHVAGIVAGLSYLNYGDYADYDGNNIHAKVAFYDLMVGDSGGTNTLKLPSDLNTLLLQWLYKSGARIFSMSWGTNSNNYDSLAQQVDNFLVANPDCMVFFSAGNNGASGSYSVGSPSTNKNGVSVGASLNDHASWVAIGNYGTSGLYSSANMAAFSSRGPTADNRLKPDLLAPGYYIYSAKGVYGAKEYHCDIQGLSGTSMAAPNAAAMGMKIRQYFMKGYYPTGTKTEHHGFTPSGALIKAMLIHSGQRVSNLVGSDSGSSTPLTTYPSNVQGYGRIQMKSVLHFAKFNDSSENGHNASYSYEHDSAHPLTLFVVGNAKPNTPQGHYALFTASGQSHTYNFTTSSSASQPNIRVTFVFTDYSGSSMANSAMINDLSIEVTNLIGQVFVPYLPSGVIRSNVQVIDIASPLPSTTYFVTVMCNTLLRSPQTYALVMTGNIQYLSSSSSTSATTTSAESYHRVDYFTSWTMSILYTLGAFAGGCFVLLIWIIRLTSKKELLKLHQQLATYLKAKNIPTKKNKVANDSSA